MGQSHYDRLKENMINSDGFVIQKKLIWIQKLFKKTSRWALSESTSPTMTGLRLKKQIFKTYTFKLLKTVKDKKSFSYT